MAKALDAFNSGNYALSIVLFEKEIRANPEDPVLYYHFALSCFYTNNFKKTIVVIREILDRFPKFIEIDRAYKILILSLIQLKDYKAALEETNNRLYISPNDLILLSFLASIHEKMNNPKEAIATHRKIIHSHSDYKNSLNSLGYLLLTSQDNPSQENIQEAIQCLKKAMSLAPNNPAYLDSFGTLLNKLGKKEQAIQALEKAVAIAPEQNELLEHLAKLKKLS